jgi:RimJ/RimL family protein N-acetyltransferase
VPPETVAAPAVPGFVLQTERVVLRLMTPDDAPFLLKLLNEPSFLEHIGDKQVRTVDDARGYIENGPMASYARFAHGLWLALRREDSAPMGMCGLIRRDTLPDPDVGYALVPRFWGHGYAREMVAATVAHGRASLGMGRIVAITSPGNEGSRRVLEACGFRLEGAVRLGADAEELHLFASDG